MTDQINLDDVATAKTTYLKGEWVKDGYRVWKAFDAERNCHVYVSIEENAYYSVNRRIRDASKTRNVFKIVMGTELDRRGKLNGYTVMSVSYTGESFEKRDAKRAQIAKRMLTRFGITV